MIVDAHTHIPAERDDWPGFLDQMRRYGITRFVTLPVGRFEFEPEPESVRWSNDHYRAFCAASGGRAVWLAYVNPQNDDCLEELERCFALGAAGVKLWVSLRGKRGGLETVHPILAAAGQRGLPVLIHTFHRAEPNIPGELNLEEFAGLAEAFPGTPLIGAHAGADWRTALGILRHRAPHACVDISGCYPEAGMLESLVEDLGPERILYGSDAFGRSVPSQLAKVRLSGLSPAVQEQILWRNAARTFCAFHGLSAGDDEAAPPAATGALPLPDWREDHFCFCGEWPFFPTLCATPRQLESVLAEAGVDRGYAGSLAAVYRRDLATANHDFAAAAAGCRRVVPLATVNPANQNWRQVLEAAREAFAGVIVYPALHHWKLDGDEAMELYRQCAEARLPLWINVALGDIRFRHTGTIWRTVSEQEMAAFAAAAPANDYVFQGALDNLLRAAAGAAGPARIRFEISRLTDYGIGPKHYYRRALALGGVERLVHGSEYPFRHPREVRWAAERVDAILPE